MNFLIKFFATGGGVSLLPYYFRSTQTHTGAGLFGTLLAWALLPLLPGSPFFQGIFLLLFLLLSVWVSGKAERLLQSHDDPRIVIDEIIGYWITMAFLPRILWVTLLGVLLFRLFDVWKPGPIRRLGELPGGWGVVMDDVLAGIFANLLLQAVLYGAQINFATIQTRF